MSDRFFYSLLTWFANNFIPISRAENFKIKNLMTKSLILAKEPVYL